jgi:hypothetical protein
VEAESTDAVVVPPEQALTEALLSLSWPLPRTVGDADAALTRLEQVQAVLTRLEQESVGAEPWWAGQVDGLATQSGFVLEWWRPVLRDPDLEWTLNHQAHLTADLATLASAGARLLDQIEPRAAEEAAEAAHARRVAQEKRWGPAAVPPFVPTGPKPGVPGARPRPPAQVFGDAVPAGAGPANPAIPASTGSPGGPAHMEGAGRVPAVARADASAGAGMRADAPPPAALPLTKAPAAIEHQGPAHVPAQAGHEVAAAALAAAVEGVAAAELGSDQLAAEPLPAPVPAPSAAASGPSALGAPPVAAPRSRPAAPEAPGNAAASARHRRPAYDFDDPHASVPTPPPPPAFPHGGLPPRSPLVPGPGFGGPPQQGRRLGPNAYPPPEYGPGPFGFVGEDDDEPESLVPTALHRHQRRLLMQTGAVLGAIGVLCWWAVYALSDNSSSHPSAAGDSTYTAAGGAERTAAGGLSTPQASAPAAPATKGAKPTTQPSHPAASHSTAPSTAASSAPDAATVSSVRVTLLGGSSAVPQIVALITVDTAGGGQVTVTGAYYGASGSKEVAAETERWTLSGKTSYQYTVPIANSAYCGTQFHFTINAGGHSSSDETQPGC